MYSMPLVFVIASVSDALTTVFNSGNITIKVERNIVIIFFISPLSLFLQALNFQISLRNNNSFLQYYA